MATTQAPLFGLDASGSIGGAITFAKWRGRTYARVKGTPSNPRSGGQIANRAMMRFLSEKWALLSAPNKATFNTLAAQGNYSPFNAYVRYNMLRWKQWLDPLIQIGEPAGTNPVMGALTLTGGVGQLTVSQVITTVNDIQGMVICASLTTGFTPAKTDVFYVANYTASPIVTICTPLKAGTWYIRTAGFSKGGTRTAFVAQQSAVVT
jgi:hypothetical protein